MNRNEEYEALLQALEQTPPALEYTVQRARARCKKSRLRRALGVPAAGLAGLAAAFVLLVNLSAPFALACGSIPILKDLAAAVAFSPSLKAAVEHDYVQYIDQEQTQNGVTLHLDSLILDKAQVTFFLQVDLPEGWEKFDFLADVTGPGGEQVQGVAITSRSFPAGELAGAVSLLVTDDVTLPQSLRLQCEIYPWETRDYKGVSPTAEFTFDIPLDSRFTDEGETLPINRWITLDGQRVLVESLDVNPTHARLNLSDDPDNTMWLSSLECYLTDGSGNRYEMGTSGSVSASGSFQTSGSISYYMDSPYFTKPEQLTLHITRITWLEKDKTHITVDLKTGTADWLPEGVSLTVEREGDLAFFTARAPEFEYRPALAYQIFQWSYLDPWGVEHSRSSGGTGTGGDNDPGYFREEFQIPVYDWDTVVLLPHFSRTADISDPITIPVK